MHSFGIKPIIQFAFSALKQHAFTIFKLFVIFAALICGVWIIALTLADAWSMEKIHQIVMIPQSAASATDPLNPSDITFTDKALFVIAVFVSLYLALLNGYMLIKIALTVRANEPLCLKTIYHAAKSGSLFRFLLVSMLSALFLLFCQIIGSFLTLPFNSLLAAYPVIHVLIGRVVMICAMPFIAMAPFSLVSGNTTGVLASMGFAFRQGRAHYKSLAMLSLTLVIINFLIALPFDILSTLAFVGLHGYDPAAASVTTVVIIVGILYSLVGMITAFVDFTAWAQVFAHLTTSADDDSNTAIEAPQTE